MNEKKSVRIPGAAAEAVAIVLNPSKLRPLEKMSVKTAEDAAKALGDEGNEHCCPLCGDYFTTQGFVAHARPCIEIRAPRERIWVAPGTPNAIQHYSEHRPTRHGGRFG